MKTTRRPSHPATGLPEPGWRAVHAALSGILAMCLWAITGPAVALEGPMEAPPGDHTISWDGAQDLGLAEDGNMARSSGDTQWVFGDDGVHPQGGSGKTLYIRGIAVADAVTVYWGPVDPQGIALSLQPGGYVTSEIMMYDALASDLPGGRVQFDGMTTLYRFDGNSQFLPVTLLCRWTMRVTETADSSPVPLVPADSLGLPENLGALVPFTSSAQDRRIHLLFEVHEGFDAWTPAYNYFNDQPTEEIVGAAQYTFESGFFHASQQPRATEARASGGFLTLSWIDLLPSVTYAVQASTDPTDEAAWSNDLLFTPLTGSRQTFHTVGQTPWQAYRLKQLP